MNRKTIILGFVLGFGPSCNDRAIKPVQSDEPSEEARVAACRGSCEQVDECFPQIGREGVEDMDACLQACLSPTDGLYFADDYRECWDEAVAALECMNALSCEVWTRPYTGEYPPAPNDRDACAGTDERTDPGPTTIHGNCIATVGAAD